ncbi:putative disease resistance protein At3g14460 [Henckelia pumila]|uniref:putative disease resistance protein At3g14460 n=1 Tax=Henckelia pumila TaxID=405737 RepID=UPI003C6DBBE6
MAVDKLFLGSHLQILFQKLSDGAAMDLARRLRVDCDFKEMRKSLLLVIPVLEDAKPVKVWLEELRDLAYDLEDVVDEITTLAFIQDAKKGIQHTKNTMLRKLIPTCSNFTPRALVSNCRLVSAIKDIRKKLNNISKQWSDRNLGGLSSLSGVMRSKSTYPFLESDIVYGRDEDKKAIKEMLLRVESSTKNFTVIPIVGMGGIGKTTLAQLLYNDEDVKGNFGVRVWVHVSQEFDVLTITKKIHQSVTKMSGTGDMDLAMLHEDLEDKFVNIKFFIVLDDVWNENYEEWHTLCSPLKFGLPGSKIIVTARNHVVASVVDSAQSAYHMKLITDEDCQCLLARRAQISFHENSHLQEVGQGLAKMCKGLPLAAKVLGGVLRSKNSESEWRDVLSSKIWSLSKENNILPVLRLSYHHLPSHLRHPFAYCSVFPKDYEFDQNELVDLWMGEGFLDVPNELKSKKDLGHEYFNELLSRSFFQRKSGRDSKFVMHDLISELAHFVSGGVCYCSDEKLDTDQDYQLPKKIRHASFLSHECELFLKLEGFGQIKGLRTFLPMPVQNSLSSPPFHLSDRILVELIPRLHSLRTLSLSGYSITELPSSVCDLILLRYLNLSGTLISTLPPSVSRLLSLEFLSLSDCRFIHKLPSTLGDLSNLCHLDISNTDQLKDLPVEISRLIRLQILPKIVLGGVGNLGLKELRWLKHLRGTFAIFELQNIANLEDAGEASLWRKSEIEDLQ